MPVLEFNHVSKSEQHTLLLDDLNFEVDEGENISIKCSKRYSEVLIQLILGEIVVTEGSINIMDQPLIKDKVQPSVHLIDRDEGFYNRMNGVDYLKLYKAIHQSKRSIKEAIDLLGLTNIKNKKMKYLTVSEKRRLSFARAFVSDTQLIVVNEGFYDIDVESKSLIEKSVEEFNKQGKSMVFLSASLDDISFSEGNIYQLNDGRLEQLVEAIETFDAPLYKIEKIPVKAQDKIVLVNPVDIKYIEADNRTTYIYFDDEKLPCSLTLNELEESLRRLGFFRTHRSYLVNLQRIREVASWTRNSYNLVLDDSLKTTIPLSKARVDELKKLLNIT